MKVKTKPARNALFGDFRLAEESSTGGWDAQCILCGAQRRFSSKSLRKNTSPTCSAPNCVKPENKQTGRYAKAPQYLTPDAQKQLDNSYSTFLANGKEARRILELETSPATGVEMTSLKMLLDLIPYAERRYRQWSTQPNAYALNSLVENARDIVRELQVAEGQDALLKALVVDSMQPCIHDIAQSMVDAANAVWMAVDMDIDKKNKAKTRDRINSIFLTEAKKIRETLEETRDRILDNTTDPAALPAKDKKRTRKKGSWK